MSFDSTLGMKSQLHIPNFLFSEKQFGEFGEAAILTLIVDAEQKNQILESLAKNLGLNEKDQGLVFEETALLKCS